jgi:hypothetical protein
VVLGLVAFAGPDKLTPTLKAGSASLVVGVLLSTVLYMQVAAGSPEDATRWLIASVVFALVLWALGFGLLCVVAGSWST